MSNILFDEECLILDACCVINLSASGVMLSILEVLPVRVAIATEVRRKEVLALPNDNPEDMPSNKLLDELIQMEMLEQVDFASEDEATTVVDLAAMGLDMGEAVSGAIAIHRNWAVATDDNRAIKVLQTRNERVRIITTPDLIHLWANHAKPVETRVRQVLTDIETRGHFWPNSRHPLYDWWQKITKGDRQ